MTLIRILIADDEPLARGYLRSLLEQEEDYEIVAECGDADSTIEAIEAERPDLVFLDVQMPGRDGFAVIEAVGSDRMPHTIFVTAHNRYAIPAFETHAIDYLLKPFDRERFRAALDRVRAQLSLQRDAEWSRRLRDVLHTILQDGSGHDESIATSETGNLVVESGQGRAPLTRIPVSVGGRVIILKSGDIEWIEAAGSYVNVHRGRDVFLLRETMSAMERGLDQTKFIRIHRRTIVNVDFIKDIRTGRTGDHQVTLRDGSVHILSRRRKKDVERLLGRSF